MRNASAATGEGALPPRRFTRYGLAFTQKNDGLHLRLCPEARGNGSLLASADTLHHRAADGIRVCVCVCVCLWGGRRPPPAPRSDRRLRGAHSRDQAPRGGPTAPHPPAPGPHPGPPPRHLPLSHRPKAARSRRRGGPS